MRPGEFRLALPVHTLTFEATYQQAKPGNEAACVRAGGWSIEFLTEVFAGNTT